MEIIKFIIEMTSDAIRLSRLGMSIALTLLLILAVDQPLAL
jgi:Na+-transporting methylmalonyl-CoA/oxaloacetate decarboxylase gamma subunit